MAKGSRSTDNSYTHPHSTAVKSCALQEMMMDDVCFSLVVFLLFAQTPAPKKGPSSLALETEGDVL